MGNYDLDLRVMELLEKLEDLIESAKPSVITNKIKLDKDEVEQIIKEIKISLPEEYQHVKFLKEHYDSIVEDAEQQAERLLVDAGQQEVAIIEHANIEKDRRLAELDQYLQASVEEHEIVRQAKRRAEEIIREANDHAAQMRMSAYEYTDDMLLRACDHFDGILRTINQNRQEMQRYYPDMDRR